MVFFLGGVVLCCIFGVGICVTDAIGVYTVCCTMYILEDGDGGSLM